MIVVRSDGPLAGDRLTNFKHVSECVPIASSCLAKMPAASLHPEARGRPPRRIAVPGHPHPNSPPRLAGRPRSKTKWSNAC